MIIYENQIENANLKDVQDTLKDHRKKLRRYEKQRKTLEKAVETINFYHAGCKALIERLERREHLLMEEIKEFDI